MEQAYFSQIRSKIIPYLNQAKEGVVIAMAWFTSAELFNALLSCLKRNVKVELVLLDNAINFMYYSPDFNEFINAGGLLRIADSSVGFMHHKFCVIDNKIAITGSYNWTYYAETRNVENIIITDNPEIVNLYLLEYRRLISLLTPRSTSTRLSWNEIEAREDIDFRELNYEIERICEVQNIPVKRFFEIKTEVVRTEIKKTPLAKYAIGIQALDDYDKVIFDPFIKSRSQLPYHTPNIERYFDSKHRKNFPCLFLYGNPNNKNEWHLIQNVDLMQLAKGTCEENLPIHFTMTLDDNGSLKIDVVCPKSGKRLTISALDSNFVQYE